MARRRAATAIPETAPDTWATAAEDGRASLDDVREAAAHCQACDLYRDATQTVFGAGSPNARVLLVGEQPGDQEDRQGAPFVGPAGRMLDRALEAAGIARADAYVTNAVKHFRWQPRGKWRIHMKPRPDQIRACRPWLLAELALVQPAVLVCMGATAAQALLGPQVRVTRDRGHPLPSPLAPVVLVTVHPSSLLRAPDDETRHREIDAFVADLRLAARALA